MARAAISFEALSAAIADIHGAGADGALWEPALQRVGSLLNSPTIALAARDPAGGLGYVASVRPEPRAATEYAQHYYKLDRLNPMLARTQVGTVLTNRMVMPQSEFVRTEFYADYAGRYAMDEAMQGHVFASSAGAGYLGLVRPSRLGTFERDEMRLLGLLLPHVRQAMHTRHLLATLGIQRDSALDALDHLGYGVVVVDAQAGIVYANAAAEAVLGKGDGLGVDATSRRRLRAATPGQTNALHHMVAQATARDGTPSEKGCRSGTLRIDRTAGDPFLLNVSPVRAGAAWGVSPRPLARILIRIPEAEVASKRSDLRGRYDLTPTEAAVAEAVSRGKGVKNAAAALGMAPSTLRWHLKTVFEMTGTTRQAELASLVERLRRGSGDDRG